jgi:MoaA/NifB/PqqE/SkfB family radical SAM enzyme
MSLHDFKTLLDDQIGITEIKLQGMGEPMMGSDTYFDMIAYARSRHIWVRSSSNASLLHLKDNYKRLIDADICDVQISVDGANKETYEAIRRGGKFDMVRRNCQMLNDYAASTTPDRTRMWVVVQKENIDELEAFPKLAAELGFNRVTLSLDLTGWGQDEWRDQNDAIDAGDIFDLSRATAAIEVGAQCGVETTFWCIDEKYVPGNAEKLCPWPFERTYISSDMRVVPCCMIANPDVSDFGDAREFKSIWNSDAYREFRQRHIDGDIPDVCRTCYDAPQD